MFFVLQLGLALCMDNMKQQRNNPDVHKFKALTERYKLSLDNWLDNGACGNVYRGRCVVDDVPNLPRGSEVAIKIMRFGEGTCTPWQWTREIEIANIMTTWEAHPNVLRVYDVIDAGNVGPASDEYPDGQVINGSIAGAIITEVCPGRSLKYFKDRRSTQWSLGAVQCRTIGLQMLRGLKFMHSRGVAHGDLAGNYGNVMYDPATNQVKLIDFGRAQKIQSPEEFGHTHLDDPDQYRLRKMRDDVFLVSLMIAELYGFSCYSMPEENVAKVFGIDLGRLHPVEMENFLYWMLHGGTASGGLRHPAMFHAAVEHAAGAIKTPGLNKLYGTQITADRD